MGERPPPPRLSPLTTTQRKRSLEKVMLYVTKRISTSPLRVRRRSSAICAVTVPRDPPTSMDRRTMDSKQEIVLPVYIFGDSHALPYRGQMFRERWTGSWVLARSKYISGLTAFDFFSPKTEEFHSELIR